MPLWRGQSDVSELPEHTWNHFRDALRFSFIAYFGFYAFYDPRL